MAEHSGERVDDRAVIGEALVRALLAEQHPDLLDRADRRLVLAGEGWDNRVFRLGEDLAVRLPSRVESVPLVANELTWLPGLVADLPSVADGGLATSAPVRAGVAGCGYPWPWTVVPWLPGKAEAEAVHRTDPAADAARLGAFLRAFGRPAPPEAPGSTCRGVPLTDRLDALVSGLAAGTARGRPLPAGVAAGRVVARVRELAATPPWPGPARWLHGDPHPLNLVVDHGRLTGIIDFGDLTSGDPASDLAARWLVFPPEARAAFAAELEADDDTWARAEGWAVALAVAYRAGAPDGSPLIRIGDRVLEELVPS